MFERDVTERLALTVSRSRDERHLAPRAASVEDGDTSTWERRENEVELAVFVGLIAVAVAIRLVAARRVAAGDGRFVWLVFLPLVVACAAVVVLGLMVVSNSLALGAVMIVVGVVLGAASLRMSSTMSASVSKILPGGDITAAVTEPIADVALLWGLLLAGGALLAVIGLIVWGVFGR